MPEFLLFAGGAALIVLFYLFQEWGGPIPYRGRRCLGKAWVGAFPRASKRDIRQFLRCFVNGMAISHDAALKFHPNDQVLDVYGSLYGGRTSFGDHMECEAFLEEVAIEFNKHLDELYQVWHREVTLGELFTFAVGPWTDLGPR